MLPRATAAILVAAAMIAAPPAHASPDLAALRVLAALPVRAADPMTGYSRGQFGPAWTDNNDAAFGHNGCDTRDDILARDLVDLVREGRCTVVSGLLHDPYTGKSIHFQRGRDTSTRVQIDHLVALGDAWITGAQQLSPPQRVDLANDPRNLLAVDGPANESKHDDDASQWLPPNTAFRCTYVADQIAVKTAYHLWITPAEKHAMIAVLSNCGP
ncbi:HNH endonuclease family protein [Mycobacterium malmoense]|uniref:HNH endonuclease family protein n=1 Tax=Mycobacterium malmoense TaxID=1780 RepID=UPI0008F80FC5|nr:hypothetical protein BMG05_18410 [Mycobacterium malmoense]